MKVNGSFSEEGAERAGLWRSSSAQFDSLSGALFRQMQLILEAEKFCRDARIEESARLDVQMIIHFPKTGAAFLFKR